MGMSSSVFHMSNSRHAHEQFGLSRIILSYAHFGPFFDPHWQRCRGVPHLFFPRARRRTSRTSLTNTKSTMAECNNVVLDLVSVTTDNDDSSSSGIDSFCDSFVMAFDQHGETFVRIKVTMIDTDDETTSRRTTITFDIIDADSSHCSSRSLSKDSWHCERAIHPSKQRHNVSARCASSSRVFLPAAIIAIGQSFVPAASGELFFSKDRSDIVDFCLCFVLSFEKWSAQPLVDAADPKVVVDFHVPSWDSTRCGACFQSASCSFSFSFSFSFDFADVLLEQWRLPKAPTSFEEASDAPLLERK
jgi:hypothetical protein